jgi:predicted Zn-dependent protease
VHPRRGFQLELPLRWTTLHDKASLVAVSPDDRAVLVLLETESKTPAEALKAFFSDGSMSAGERWDGTVGGFPVVSSSFASTDEEGRTLMGLIAFVAFDGVVLALVAIGPQEGWSERADSLARTFASFSRVDPRMKKVEPMRVRVRVLETPSTITELAKGGPVDAKSLALVNQVTPDEQLPKGRAVKLVTPSTLGE